MKLGRSNPCLRRSAIHSASFTSVLRPGTALMWCAFTTHTVNRSSNRLTIGFQYTPVLSIATCVTSISPSQFDNATSCRGRCAKGPRLLTFRRHQTGHHRILVNVQTAATLIYDSHRITSNYCCCRPVGGCPLKDFAMRALRRSGATFLCSCQPPRQIPRRARCTNDKRPSCTARRDPIFITLCGLN